MIKIIGWIIVVSIGLMVGVLSADYVLNYDKFKLLISIISVLPATVSLIAWRVLDGLRGLRNRIELSHKEQREIIHITNLYSTRLTLYIWGPVFLSITIVASLDLLDKSHWHILYYFVCGYVAGMFKMFLSLLFNIREIEQLGGQLDQRKNQEAKKEKRLDKFYKDHS
ncbi:hypothetical protein KB976_002730 [Vibrio parahaemolyticus]|nr:hypothetical protein [Vibrio parahaemolyticus]